MPIPLPDLDDRSYAELTAQARALIPNLDPAWTNYNPSDPGIMLTELLAWLTEMLLFQVNQVPPASTETFLRLLNGRGQTTPAATSLDDAIRHTITGLRERYRAVTADDYEWLALHAWPHTSAARAFPGGGRLARVHCLPRLDLSATDPPVRRAEAPAHLSLVVLPETVQPDSGTALRGALWEFFDERRTLTTRHHVVAPGYVPVEVSANLALHDGARPFRVLSEARQELLAFYDPVTGGQRRDGWPFGRAVYASEASGVLEQVRQVDYVEDVLVGPPGPADGGQVVELAADQLVQLRATWLVAYDTHGRRYVEPLEQP